MQRRQRLPSRFLMLSFFMAIILTVYPLPPELLWYRPQWIVLFFVFWMMLVPEKVGMVSAWFVGILLDSLQGAVLGQHALALSVVAYMMFIFYRRVRMYSILQQMVVVFFITLLYQALCLWVESLWHGDSYDIRMILPALTTAVIWPFVLMCFPVKVRNTFY